MESKDLFIISKKILISNYLKGNPQTIEKVKLETHKFTILKSKECAFSIRIFNFLEYFLMIIQREVENV